MPEVVSKKGFVASAFHPRVGLIGSGGHEKVVTKLTTSQTGIMKLSPMDRLEAFSWTPILFPFENVNQEKDFMPDSRMIESLQKVVERVPIVTGHLERIDGTPVCFEGPNSPLQVCVGTRSVWYTSETIRGRFQDFKASNFSYEHLDPNFLFKAANSAILEGKEYPLLTAKVNRFDCGSVLLLLTACHLIVDARSIYELVRTWAMIYSGQETAPLIKDSRHLFSFDDELNERTRPIYEYFKSIQKRPAMPFKTTKLVHASIDETKIKEYKLKINQELSPEWVSSDDVMVSLGWRAITRARGTQPNNQVMLVRIYDMRSMNQPPLPPSSFGNGVLASLTEMTSASRVLETPISEFAKYVRSHLSCITPATVRDSLTAFNKMHMLDHPPGGNTIPFSENSFSSSYSGFLPKNIDFQNSPALTVTRACLTDGIIAPQPIINGVYSCKLAIDSECAEKLANDSELIKVGFKLEL